MDVLLQQAYERRDRLRQELATIEGFISQYEALKGDSRPSTNLELPLEATARSESRTKRKRTDVSNVMAAAADAILQAGRPLSRGTLLRTLEDQGFTFPGGDKIKVFGTNIWRSDKFINVKGVGYWPLSHPLPPEFEHDE